MKNDDDDIQDYVSSGWRKREIAMQQMSRIGQEIEEMQRNEVLEEVAKAVYEFKAFEKDTMDSFVAYIRSMKRWTKKRPVRCADSALQKLKARTVEALNSGAVLHAMN